MKQLLQNYYYRLRKHSTFYAVLGLIVFLTVAINLISLLTTINYDQTTNAFFYEPEEVYLDAVYFGTISPIGVNLLVQVVIIELLSKDHKYDTFRNMLLAGKSRIQVFFASLIVSLSIYVFFTIVELILMYGLGGMIGFTISGYGGLDDFLSHLMYFFCGIALTCFTCFMTMVFKNKAITYILVIALLVLNSILSTFGNIGVIDGIEFYKFNEFFWSYATNKIIYGNLDHATYFVNYRSVYVEGRTLALTIKNLSMDIIVGGLSVFFGQFAFSKIDLK